MTVVRVEDRVLGAAGITRIRVGYLAEGAGTELTPGIDGCFCLARHPTADFSIRVSRPVSKDDPGYPAELERAKKVALAISDPVAALRANDLDDRFDAALYLGFRYQWPRFLEERELIPEEENNAILDVLAEVPWGQGGWPAGAVPTDRPAPHREFLWNKFDLNKFGFERPAGPQPDMEGATSRFLRENRDRIRLDRYVQKR